MPGSAFRSQLVGSILFAAASVASAATGAQAEALLVQTQGNVLVNTGDGFQTPVTAFALKSGGRTIAVDGPMTLRQGDRVMVRRKSSAELHYGDGCKVPLSAGALVTISSRSPCAVKAACTTGNCTVLSSGGIGGLSGGVAGVSIGVVAPLVITAITLTVKSKSSSAGKVFASP